MVEYSASFSLRRRDEQLRERLVVHAKPQLICVRQQRSRLGPELDHCALLAHIAKQTGSQLRMKFGQDAHRHQQHVGHIGGDGRVDFLQLFGLAGDPHHIAPKWDHIERLDHQQWCNTGLGKMV